MYGSLYTLPSVGFHNHRPEQRWHHQQGRPQGRAGNHGPTECEEWGAGGHGEGSQRPHQLHCLPDHVRREAEGCVDRWFLFVFYLKIFCPLGHCFIYLPLFNQESHIEIHWSFFQGSPGQEAKSYKHPWHLVYNVVPLLFAETDPLLLLGADPEDVIVSAFKVLDPEGTGSIKKELWELFSLLLTQIF